MAEYMKFPSKIEPRSTLDIAISRSTVFAAIELGKEPNDDSPDGVSAREGDKLLIRGFSEYDFENPVYINHS